MCYGYAFADSATRALLCQPHRSDSRLDEFSDTGEDTGKKFQVVDLCQQIINQTGGNRARPNRRVIP
jgi:hypothetical protein